MRHTLNGVEIVPGLRVRVIALGHECESNVGNPAFSGPCVRVVMHRGCKLVRPSELEAVEIEKEEGVRGGDAK